MPSRSNLVKTAPPAPPARKLPPPNPGEPAVHAATSQGGNATSQQEDGGATARQTSQGAEKDKGA